MPSSQAAAPERRTERTVTHEPPKLKTTLKTPPKQATNPLQFVKVGPCSLYRTAQEQLQKVQEVKKIKQEIRDDPEDWQSNLDNWKSSRRKRQEHIIERVVEVKKLELEEHDRQRRRSKTFSEMMEERNNRGRKLSISLAVYNEEDANDLSDLGIGTSSGKSSVSGDTHDDTHSVLSDRDSEIDKNHSDVDNASHENGNDTNDNSALTSSTTSITTTTTTIDTQITSTTTTTTTTSSSPLKKEILNNGFHKNGSSNNHNSQEYDSATTATASSPEPEEYTYEGAIRGYVSRVSQNIPRRSLADLDAKLENVTKSASSNSPTKVSLNNLETKTNGAEKPVVKVDILKRREIFEKASKDNVENKNNNNNRLDFGSTKSIKERLSILERQKSEAEALEKVSKSPRHSVDSTNSVRERFNREKLSSEKEFKTRDLVAEELEGVKPLRERLSHLEKYTSNEQGFQALNAPSQHNGEVSAKSIKDRLISLDANRCKDSEKRSNNCYHEQTNNRVENSTPSERSSSPDSEYRAPRATFHQSLDSLDADASSGPDTFERVQSLEELDYHQARRYPASSSSAEILNDTDREDSGIHTADASCSVSQADEPIEEEIGNNNIVNEKQQQPAIIEEKTEFRSTIETTLVETSKNLERVEEKIVGTTSEPESCNAVLTETGTAEISSSSSTSTSGEPLLLSANDSKNEPQTTNANAPHTYSSSSRPVVYQSPRVPPRRSPPEILPKPKSYLPGQSTSEATSPKDEILPESPSEDLSTPDSSSTNTVCSLNLSLEPEYRNVQSTMSDRVSSGSNSPQNAESKVSSLPTSPLHTESKTYSVPTSPLHTESKLSSVSSSPSHTISSPLPSPRSPSKIPTPLPRKTIVTSPTSSTCSLTSPTSPTCPSPSSPLKSPPPVSPKPRTSLQKVQMPSEIPVLVKSNSSCTSPTSPTSPPTSPRSIPSQNSRRHTVVEVCEKVVVPRGQALVTPFITVERYADEASGGTEVRVDEQLSTAYKKS